MLGVDDYAQFFVQLARQGRFGRFTALDLPARKLPKTCHCLAIRTLLNKNPPGIIDQGRGNDQKQIVRQSSAPFILAIP